MERQPNKLHEKKYYFSKKKWLFKISTALIVEQQPENGHFSTKGQE